MVSEDSDQVVSGLPPVHRLRDLGDLDETVDIQMMAGGDELDTPSELLEVLLLRGPHPVLLEERNNRLQQIRATPHDVSVQVLPMIVIDRVLISTWPTPKNSRSAWRESMLDAPCVTANSCATW